MALKEESMPEVGDSSLDLNKYCMRALEAGGAHAKVISPGSVVTAPWVRLKCQFGCPGYGRSHCCPPDSPTPEQTRTILDSYQRAILFHYATATGEGWRRRIIEYFHKLIDLEVDMFKDGYYKAFVILSGPCTNCRECAKPKELACSFRGRARPCMEACGIDVFQTARDHGFSIAVCREKTDPQNHYCLMLVD